MMVRVCVAMICVSFVGLCGRLLARRLTKQPLLWDDWLIVVGLVFAWSCCIIQLIGGFASYEFMAYANKRHQGLELRIMVGMRTTQLQRVQ